VKDTWETPDYLFNWLDNIFQFGVDAAADFDNAKCNDFWHEGDNSLRADWAKAGKEVGTIFCNPPYSRPNLELFTKKAYEEGQGGANSVLIVPLDVTGWFQNWVFNKAEIWIPDERICFIDPDNGKPGESPSKGTQILIYGPMARVGYTKFVHIPRD
jgi:phage N-6-adenine-methyltransferase